MGKKPPAMTNQADTIENTSKTIETPSNTSEVVEIDLSKPTIMTAIKAGKAVIVEGKTKADAARVIFEKIKDEPKEVIVAAFMEGATLTAKGALTYWYNVRRKAAKAASAAKVG